MIRKHFRLKRVLLGLAFALVAAPTAQAYTGLMVDGPTPGIQSPTDARHAALLNRHTALSQVPLSQLQIQAMRWNAMAAAYQRQASQSQRPVSEISVQPKPLSQLQIQGMRWNAMAAAYQSKSPVRSESVSAAGSDGFNWNDAGIGASVAFGVTLLLLLSVALGRRYHTRSDGGRLAST